MRLHVLLFLALLLTPITAKIFAADDVNCEIIVTVDQTDEGKKVAPPTHEHPAYYFPIVAGYREEGFRMAGETAPDKSKIIQMLAKALAKQNYLVVSAKTPPPSVLLAFHWGTINPSSDPTDVDNETGDPVTGPITEHEARKMTALVVGHSASQVDPHFDHALFEAVRENRYFVVIIAYDWAAAQKHERKQLWIAKMSTPSAGISLDDVASALITTGAPFFGRETARPMVKSTSILPRGKVEMGPLETKELFENPEAPSAKKEKNPK